MLTAYVPTPDSKRKQINKNTAGETMSLEDLFNLLAEPPKQENKQSEKPVCHNELRNEPIKKSQANPIVDHPAHYNVGGIEVIDFIEAKGLNFALGNVVKYVTRAGHKDNVDPVEDLKKARWYINREIEKLENKRG